MKLKALLGIFLLPAFLLSDEAFQPLSPPQFDLPQDKVSSSQMHSFSGEFLYFSLSGGYSLGGRKKYPGYRIGYTGNFGPIEFKTTFLDWAFHDKNFGKVYFTYNREFFSVKQKVELKKINSTIGYVIPHKNNSVTPFIGIDLEESRSRYDFEESSYYNSVFVYSSSLGPLVGTSYLYRISAASYLLTAFSFSYNQDQIASTSYYGRRYSPRTNLSSHLTKKYSFKNGKSNLLLSIGYESHLHWLRYSSGKIYWKAPNNLQGLSSEIKFAF